MPINQLSYPSRSLQRAGGVRLIFASRGRKGLAVAKDVFSKCSYVRELELTPLSLQQRWPESFTALFRFQRFDDGY